MLLRYPYDFKFSPREYQKDVLKAFFVDKFRNIFLVQHRRSGKDRLCFIMMIGAALQRPGLYLYLFPKAVQGRKALFRARGSDGVEFLSMIPSNLIVKKNAVEMSVTLINGSIIQVSGASTADTLVGSNPLGIVYSEYSLMSPSVRDYMSPIIAENSGWQCLNLTPRGRGPTYDLFMHAVQDPKWFVRHLSVNDTRLDNGLPVVSDEEIESFRRSGVEEAIIQQEFYVSWNSSNVGSFYATDMDNAEIDGRICDFPIKKHLKCFSFFDVGIADCTSVWVLQPDGDNLKMVYFYEANNYGFEHYALKLKEIEKELGIKIIQNYGPPDLRQRQWGDVARSALRIAQDCGLHFQIVPSVSIEDGIQSVKSIFPYVWFHKTNCKKGIESLRHYRREYNENLRTYKTTALHDWSSHGADSFRYFAVVWRENFARPDQNTPIKYKIVT